MLKKSSSIRPRDKNLEPQYIKSENRKTSQRGASSPLIVVYGFLAIILAAVNNFGGFLVLVVDFPYHWVSYRSFEPGMLLSASGADSGGLRWRGKPEKYAAQYR